MNDNQDICLVILAGGQSRRMGSDKAAIEFQGQRLVDRLINRFQGKVSRLFLSSRQDYGTSLPFIPDNPASPAGPVGGIFSIAEHLLENEQNVRRFCTIPVDAPHASPDLVQNLSASKNCAVAAIGEQLQPTFACWDCATINTIRTTHDSGDSAPSLHWLARQCGADIIEWSDAKTFANVNTPGDLANLTTEF